MYGTGISIKPYTNKQSWKIVIEVDDSQVPEELKLNPWSFNDTPLDITTHKVE